MSDCCLMPVNEMFLCFQLTIEITNIEYQMKCVNLNNGHIWTVDSNEVSYGSKYKVIYCSPSSPSPPSHLFPLRQSIQLCKLALYRVLTSGRGERLLQRKLALCETHATQRSKTCIRRSPLVQRKSVFIRQVAS